MLEKSEKPLPDFLIQKIIIPGVIGKNAAK